MKSAMSTIAYRNTDLMLELGEDLSLLVQELCANGLFALHCTLHDTTWYAALEIDRESESAEDTLACFLNAIESLTPSARLHWDQCRKRELDVAFDCGDEPWAFNTGLSHATLSRLVAVGASLRLTLYPERPETNAST